MRIAVVSPFGGGTVYGGPAVFLNRLFEPLAAEHEITVVYGQRGPADVGFAWARRAVPLMRFGSYGADEQLMWSARAAWWLWRNGDDYDVAHIHGASFFNLLSAVGALARRRRYVVVALTGGGDLSPRARVGRIPVVSAVRRALVRRAAVGYALSAAIGHEFRELGLAPCRVAPMYNPVDTVRYAPPAGPDDPRSRLRAIGSVGMVGERKRSELVLDVLAVLRRDGWPATAVLVGPFESAAYEQRFRSRAETLQVAELVETVGYTDDVAPIVNARMSVLLNPSSQEGLPGALVEAMASGVPAIVTDVGAMGDIVRAAGAGFVVDPDAAQIAAAVGRLWADSATWSAHSRRAREFAVAHFSGPEVGAAYLDAVIAPELAAV